MDGFVTFIRKQGVMGLAVGFLLGGAASKLVSSLVEDLVQPVLGLVLGSTEGLAALTLGPVKYGHFLAVLLDFIVVAFVVYAVFKKLQLESLDVKKS